MVDADGKSFFFQFKATNFLFASVSMSVVSAASSSAAEPWFKITSVGGVVVIVSFTRQPTMAGWNVFRTTVLNVYAKYRHFVLVFDLRNLGIPKSLDVMDAMRSLVVSLKPFTNQQVLAVVVLTPYVVVRELLLALLKCAGQAAPFYAFTSPEDAADTCGALYHIVARTPGANLGPLQPPTPKTGSVLTWGALTPGSRAACVLLTFLKYARHYIRGYKPLVVA